MKNEIDRLLLEAQRSRLGERRTEPRHPFVRPVLITTADGTTASAFSRDMSQQGIGIITQLNPREGTVAVLTIHSTSEYPVHLKSEVRWSQKFGKGWYLTGWKFMGVAAPPMQGPGQNKSP